jgi:hypothetical protein
MCGEGGGMNVEWYGGKLENDTSTLDRLDDVFWALSNENESSLVRVEFENAAEGLLGHLGEIRLFGVVKQDPCHGAVLGLLAAHEFR